MTFELSPSSRHPTSRGRKVSGENAFYLRNLRPGLLRFATSDSFWSDEPGGTAIITVLVTDGADCVGTHLVLALLERGEHIVVLDNLSTGIRDLVSEAVVFVEGDAGDGACVRCRYGPY